MAPREASRVAGRSVRLQAIPHVHDSVAASLYRSIKCVNVSEIWSQLHCGIGFTHTLYFMGETEAWGQDLESKQQHAKMVVRNAGRSRKV